MILGVAALYFISTFSINRVMKVVEARVRVPGMIGGK
jgi:glutamate/aspartate transport system permease protein